MAAKWVPALGAVVTAIQLAENLVAAADRAMALNQWIKNQKDLKRAQDALESSAQNFVKNQGEQFAHYTIQAAFNVALLIGQVLELSGITSAAGTGLKAAAEAGSAAEEVIYEFYRKATLEAAWSLTQKALRTPKNRRLALEARALNPTLAKYSIAWSAMVRENPMARNIVNEIGLSERTLRQKDANVKSVVKFMELKFSDDIQVRKRVELKEDYMPSPVELTAKCWCLAKVRAEKANEQKLEKAATGKLDGLMAEVGTNCAKLTAAIANMTHTPEMAEDSIGLLDNLESELNAYQPMAVSLGSGKKELHPAMSSFVEDLLDLIVNERIKIRDALAKTKLEESNEPVKQN